MFSETAPIEVAWHAPTPSISKTCPFLLITVQVGAADRGERADHGGEVFRRPWVMVAVGNWTLITPYQSASQMGRLPRLAPARCRRSRAQFDGTGVSQPSDLADPPRWMLNGSRPRRVESKPNGRREPILMPVCPTLPPFDRAIARKIVLRQFPVGRSM
jgi:hypothetical protein